MTMKWNTHNLKTS